MKKIKLDLQPKFKLLQVNGKDIKIPKLGLKHRMLADINLSYSDNMKRLISSIHPNLSIAERDLVSLNILAYNDKIRNEFIEDGFTYRIDDVYICQKLKFELNGYEFKFKSPNNDSLSCAINDLLEDCCVYVKKDGIKQEIPNFLDLPSFVANWADDILNTIAIDTPNGKIVGLYSIVELFDYE